MKFLTQGTHQRARMRQVYTMIAGAFIAVFLLPSPYSLFAVAEAATLSLDPSKGAYGPGDTFVVTVRLDPAVDECVNAATIELVYPKELVKASAVSKGESVLTLWPSEPIVDHEQGIVSFSGGVPAGYCGRIQGDPGKTNILAKVIFSIAGDGKEGKDVATPTAMPITFGPGTIVLKNDGFGTPAQVSLISGVYTRTLTSNGAPNEWLEIVHADAIKPDIFVPMLHQDSQMFQGKHFIIFSAIDKQSGVHHYEVSEDDPKRFGMVRGKAGEIALFVNATSPYVLRDQELGSRVIVRAIDNAGNIQETILPPTNGSELGAGDEGKAGGSVWWYVFLAGIIVIGGGVFVALRFVKHADPV